MMPLLKVTRPSALAPVCILLNVSVLSMAIQVGVDLPTEESLASRYGEPNAMLCHSLLLANSLLVHTMPSNDVAAKLLGPAVGSSPTSLPPVSPTAKNTPCA